MNKRLFYKGFTIVELLVVVVVIAILATITIVAYNGIQQHARTVAILSAVDTWQKNIQLDAVTYTPPGSGVAESYWQCMGRAASDFPAQNGFLAGECITQTDGSVSISIRWDGLYSGGTLDTPAPAANWWSPEFSRINGLLPVVQLSQGGVTTRIRGIAAVVSRDSQGKRTVTAMYGTQDGKCGQGSLAGADDMLPGDIKGGYCNIMMLQD